MAEADFAARVRAAQRGDPAACRELVRDFHAVVLRDAQRLLRDAEEAQDCTQEAFAEAFATLERLREPLAWPGWLRSIVRHRCLRRLRRQDLQLVPLSQGVEALVPDLAGAHRERFLEQWAHAGRLIAALPPLERDVTVLFYLKQCTQQEIASFLGLPLSTVNNRLHQARERLVHSGDTTMTESSSSQTDASSERASRIGTIIKVDGPVIDVRFDSDLAVELFGPIAVAVPGGKPEERMLVSRARGRGVVSCLATSELDDTLQVGAAVLDTGPMPSSFAPAGARLPAVPSGVVARARSVLAPPRSGSPRLLETGIKAIDLLCPLPDRGSVAQVGTAFVGRMVLLDELSSRLKDSGARLTCFCMVDRTEPDPYRGLLQAEPASDTSALDCYWVLCGEPADPGYEGLRAHDALLYHSPLLALQRLYPTLDPQRSWSQLLGPELPGSAHASQDHVALAARAREALLLARQALTDPSALELFACRAFRAAARTLEEHAARVLAGAPVELQRAHKLQLFLTQPFEAARSITGWPGVSVPLADTLAGVRSILDGGADELPAGAFRYRGNLDDVRRHAHEPRQY